MRRGCIVIFSLLLLFGLMSTTTVVNAQLVEALPDLIINDAKVDPEKEDVIIVRVCNQGLAKSKDCILAIEHIVAGQDPYPRKKVLFKALPRKQKPPTSAQKKLILSSCRTVHVKCPFKVKDQKVRIMIDAKKEVRESKEDNNISIFDWTITPK